MNSFEQFLKIIWSGKFLKSQLVYTVAFFPKHFFREFLKSIISVKNKCEIKCVDMQRGGITFILGKVLNASFARIPPFSSPSRSGMPALSDPPALFPYKLGSNQTPHHQEARSREAERAARTGFFGVTSAVLFAI